MVFRLVNDFFVSCPRMEELPKKEKKVGMICAGETVLYTSTYIRSTRFKTKLSAWVR